MEVGHYHRAIYQYQAAAENYKRSLDIADGTSDHGNVLWAAHHLATLHHDNYLLDEASGVLLRYQSYYESPFADLRLRGERAIILSNQADEQKSLPSAQSFCIEALSHFFECGVRKEELLHILCQHIHRLVRHRETFTMVNELAQAVEGLGIKESEVTTMTENLIRAQVRGEGYKTLRRACATAG